MRKIFVLLAWLCAAVSAQAQIHLSVNKPKPSHLLYSPLVVEVRIANNTGRQLHLGDVDGQSWLRFLIKRGNGAIVRPTYNFSQPELVLEPGQGVEFGFDLTPFYNIREMGNYKLIAVVKMAGVQGDLISNSVDFSVVTGQKLWSRQQGMPGSDEVRTFSLISFFDGQDSQVFAQIESERENLVFLCLPLGNYMATSKPEAELEAGSYWHLLFRSAPGFYLYLKTDMEGKVIERRTLSSAVSIPRLMPGPNGYAVVGGTDPSQERGETLSGTQPPEFMRPGGVSELDEEKPSGKKKKKS